jgi:heterodisulfide reductase subunit A-like polyferredoxin
LPAHKKYKQYYEYLIPLDQFYTKNLRDAIVLKIEYRDGNSIFYFMSIEDMNKWAEKYAKQIKTLEGITAMRSDIKAVEKKEAETGYLGRIRSQIETIRGLMKSDDNII